MLRITVQDTPNQVTLKLEGSIAGAWVAELEEVWRVSNSKLAGRVIRVDMTDVDRVDLAGKYLLALLRDRGTVLVASGKVTQIEAEIIEGWTLREKS
jgi:ABC-type transporter Mla MlaB component